MRKNCWGDGKYKAGVKLEIEQSLLLLFNEFAQRLRSGGVLPAFLLPSNFQAIPCYYGLRARQEEYANGSLHKFPGECRQDETK